MLAPRMPTECGILSTRPVTPAACWSQARRLAEPLSAPVMTQSIDAVVRREGEGAEFRLP